MPSARLLLVTLVAALAGAAAVPSVAQATPCWQRVLQDWSQDGVISKHYSPRCLRQAIKNTPEDLRDYTPILDDLNAALFDATGGKSGSNGPNHGGGSHGGGAGAGGGGGGSGSGPGAGSMGPTGNANSKGNGSGKLVVPFAGTSASAPSHSRAVPLPLIILGSVLLLGVLAAGSPPVYRRLRGRFPRLRPSADSVRPQS